MTNSVWGGYNNHTSHVISNPFMGGDLWQPSSNLVNNNMPMVDNTLNNSANPFRQIQFPVNNGGTFGKRTSRPLQIFIDELKFLILFDYRHALGSQRIEKQ